jgi:hypothetical protein
MAEYPEDLGEIALDIVLRIESTHVWKQQAVDDIAKAILAERERCANLAEDQHGEGPSMPFDNGGTSDGWNMATRKIAKLIRGEE